MIEMTFGKSSKALASESNDSLINRVLDESKMSQRPETSLLKEQQEVGCLDRRITKSGALGDSGLVKEGWNGDQIHREFQGRSDGLTTERSMGSNGIRMFQGRPDRLRSEYVSNAAEGPEIKYLRMFDTGKAESVSADGVVIKRSTPGASPQLSGWGDRRRTIDPKLDADMGLSEVVPVAPNTDCRFYKGRTDGLVETISDPQGLRHKFKGRRDGLVGEYVYRTPTDEGLSAVRILASGRCEYVSSKGLVIDRPTGKAYRSLNLIDRPATKGK